MRKSGTRSAEFQGNIACTCISFSSVHVNSIVRKESRKSKQPRQKTEKCFRKLHFFEYIFVSLAGPEVSFCSTEKGESHPEGLGKWK